VDEAKEMNKSPVRHPMLKDSVACGTVLATMMLTMACGAFVVDAGTDAAPHVAQVAAEASHD
jgi:hypothetical protein